MALLPTFDELYEQAKAEIQLRRPDLTDFNEGSVLDGMTGAAAVLADETIRVSVEQFSEQFFDTATGAALDALAQDRFGISRKAASASIGQVEWTRGTAGAYTILAGTRFRAVVGAESITVQATEAVTVQATDTTVTVPVQAMTTGRATNAAAGTVTQILDASLADPTATCTNPQPLAGGSDAQTDESFRDQIRRLYSTLRRGTRSALETGALSVPGVAIVTIDETDAVTTGHVGVYVGDPDARSNDSLATLVQAELENWRPVGILVDVFGSEREEVPLAIGVTIETGADQVAIGSAIRAAAVAYADTLSAGQRAERSRVEKASHDASDLVVAVDVLTSSTALEPTLAYNAIRFTPETISITYTEV